MFCCLECGHKFKTTKAAERAVNNGCPGCGGVDIDLDSEGQTEALAHQQKLRDKHGPSLGRHEEESE